MSSFLNTSKIAAVALTLAFAVANIGGAAADTPAQKHHPRRAEVNHRLNRENKRVNHKVADGQINRRQAAALHRDDHQIRQEERDMAHQDGGHITKSEQRTLNQQENHVSKDIHNE